MAANTEQRDSYFPELDGLRTVAITLVIVEHFGGLLAKPLSIGYYGVDLFFVISGFLITGILLRSRAGFFNALTTFLGRRSLRIFPVYYVVLAILWICNFENTREGFVWLATYTWNYYAALHTENNWLFYLWSLSVEEQFYVFWPFLVLSLRKHLGLLSGITVLIVSLSYAQLMFNVLPAISVFNYTGLPNRMGSLCLGAVGAILFSTGLSKHRFLSSRAVEVAISVVLVFALARKDSRLQFPLMGVCSLLIVLKCAHGLFGFALFRQILSHRLMIGIGRISYCIYLCHWPLGLAFSEFIFDPIWLSLNFTGPLEKLRWNAWIFKLPLVYLISVLTAAISWKFFESPMLHLKERLFPTVRSSVVGRE